MSSPTKTAQEQTENGIEMQAEGGVQHQKFYNFESPHTTQSCNKSHNW